MDVEVHSQADGTKSTKAKEDGLDMEIQIVPILKFCNLSKFFYVFVKNDVIFGTFDVIFKRTTLKTGRNTAFFKGPNF